MTQRLRTLSFLLVALSAGACKSDPAGPAAVEESRLSSAKSRWESARPAAYAFTAFRSCECLSDAAGPVRILVNGTTIVSVRRMDNDAPVDPTLWFDIDKLFDLIDIEIEQRPSRLEAEYDTNDGHPTFVAYGEREVDGGAAIDITAFAGITGGTGGYIRR